MSMFGRTSLNEQRKLMGLSPLSESATSRTFRRLGLTESQDDIVDLALDKSSLAHELSRHAEHADGWEDGPIDPGFKRTLHANAHHAHLHARDLWAHVAKHHPEPQVRSAAADKGVEHHGEAERHAPLMKTPAAASEPAMPSSGVQVIRRKKVA